MTDDKRARKYALERKKNLHLSQRDTNLIHLAYLHGLKDGKPKWHDLRKNPNDLPESSIFNEVLNENGMKVFYDDINKTWCMFLTIILLKQLHQNFGVNYQSLRWRRNK